MHAAEIRDQLRQQPFMPLRIFVSDGSVYEIQEPECVYIDRRVLAIGVEIDEDGLPARTMHINPIHITRIEPLIDGETDHNGTPQR